MIFKILMYVIFFLIAFVIPAVCTFWNLWNLCSKRPKAKRAAAWVTLTVGGVLYAIVYSGSFSTAGNWWEQVYTNQLHYSLSSAYKAAVIVPTVLGGAGLLALINIKAEKLPPLVSAGSIAGVLLLNVLQVIYAIQIGKNVYGIKLMLYVYHANIFMLSISAVRDQIKQQLKIFAAFGNDDMPSWLSRKINCISRYGALVFACLFVIIAVLEIIFILTGQGADAAIKAFTDTADWTFSQQIPPPPKEYKGHYLCTVAAGGHKKVVKPLRLGTRHGATIVVNRQLCIANAFEDYIQEKLPRFHKVIRGAYDKYGYPVSKHITTPRRADAVYILMKPLEWVFLIFLYLFDTKPEQRISRQYRYKGESEV